jgi:hypothetical protein
MNYLTLWVATELALLPGFLYCGPVARLLGHAPPNRTGAGFARLAFPAVLLADVLYKRIRRGDIR